jgi:hypothetical protein
MKSPIRRSAALPVLVAAALLVGAGSGGAVAGAMITGKQIKDNTVTGKDIKNRSLTGIDLKDGTLTGADLKDGSLGSADIADGSLQSGDLAPGTRAELDPVVSGRITPTGDVAVLRAAPGVKVETSRLSAGRYCVTLTGTSQPLNHTTAAMVVTPDYAHDLTSTSSGNTALAEVDSVSASCPTGFQVLTLYRNSSGSVYAADQGFHFLAH